MEVGKVQTMKTMFGHKLNIDAIFLHGPACFVSNVSSDASVSCVS